MVPGPGLLIGFGLLLLAAGLILEHQRRRLESRAIGAAATVLTARHEGRTLHGEHEGTRYRCWYTPATRHSSPSVTVAIPTGVPGGFCVAREGAAHRFWKRVRLSREVTTGDPEFDHDFYVTTDAPTFAAAVLSRPEARAAVAALFQLRCHEVCHTRETLEARWRHVGAGAVDPPILRLAVSHLATVEGVIARVPAEPVVAAPVRTGATFLAAVPLLLGLGGVLGLTTGPELTLLDPGALFVASLQWSLPAAGFYLVVAATSVAGRSTSHRELAAIAVLALVGFPLAGFAAARQANVRLDVSAPRAHQVRVLHKYRSTVRGVAAGRWVEVESWRAAGRERLPLSSSDWERIGRTGPSLTVVTREGRLGFEWVASYRVGTP